MKTDEVNEIIACLPKGRTQFYYFKDRYAFLLLGLVAEQECRISTIRESAFGSLLNKPTVREHLADAGAGVVDREFFEGYAANAYNAYVLTLGRWGHDKGAWYRNCQQTTRRGCNLVLQLNFSREHDRAFKKLQSKYSHVRYDWGGHPTSKKRTTLGWCRMDIDLDGGEALIEEIQTDWVRDVVADVRWYERQLKKSSGDYAEYLTQKLGAFREYLDSGLGPHVKVWDEALLTAAIWFLVEEIGITRIFYHTWNCGNALKAQLERCAPPKSLYTTVPKRFCFERTDRIPCFLYERSVRRLMKGRRPVEFFMLDLEAARKKVVGE